MHSGNSSPAQHSELYMRGYINEFKNTFGRFSCKMAFFILKKCERVEKYLSGSCKRVHKYLYDIRVQKNMCGYENVFKNICADT